MWYIVAMLLRRRSWSWSWSKDLLGDFDKATFGGIANANSDGGRISFNFGQYLLHAETDKHHGAEDDIFNGLRKVITNETSWLWRINYLQYGVTVTICNVLSGPTVLVSERCYDSGVIAKCVGDLISSVGISDVLWLVGIIVCIVRSLAPWASGWLNEVE